MKEMKSKYGSTRYSFIIIGCILLGGLMFTACKKSNDNNNGNTAAAGLMAFNLAPDKPSIGINLSGSSLLPSPLSYTAYSGGYIPVSPGNSSITAFDNGSSSFTSSQYSFDTSKYYSLFVVGNSGSYKNVVVKDNFDSLTAMGGTAYLRYINAIPDSSKPTVTITAGGTSVVNTTAAYTTVSPFVAVAAGSISVGLTNESTVNTNRIITLEEKKVYTILLLGNPAASDSANKPQIRFIQNGSL